MNNIEDFLPRHSEHLFIGGEWEATSAKFEIISSHSEEPVATIGLADEAQMDRAIMEARRAFDDGPWPRMTHEERAGFLRKIADGLALKSQAMCNVWAHEVGVPTAVSSLWHPSHADTFNYYADIAETYPFRELRPTQIGRGTGLLVREPVGVVGAIVPWNSPIALISMKLAPALLAGCTIILKMAREAPIEALLFAEICEEAGLPRGVVNVVTADREISEQLVRDERVDMISFTGSSATGRRIGAICGGRVARTSLELGGKSAAIVLDDCRLDVVARAMQSAIAPMAGQACSFLSRVIVSRHRHDQLVEAMATAFDAIQVGDPFDAKSEMGPLATQQHLGRVQSYIERGQSEGAALAAGGQRPDGCRNGWYLRPTLLANVAPDATVAQEEIFGPVVAVIPVDDEEQAVQVAENTIFGLNSAIFAEDPDRAYRVAQTLKSGTVGHNSYWIDLNIGAGGFKQSGIGREGGTEGLLPFLESKTILIAAEPGDIASLELASSERR